MQASVHFGISFKPWLVTTTTAAHSFSKWATSVLPVAVVPLHSPTHQIGHHVIRNSVWNGRRGSRGGCDNSSKVGWNGGSGGVQLGLWDTAKDGRDSSFLPSSRRGFLTELQSLRDEGDGGGSVEFESPLEIVLYPDPRLRKKNRRITVFDDKLEQLVKEMFEIMYRTDGVGLAAPQVGVNVQLMLYNPEGERGRGAEYILVNPKIVKYGKQRDVFREGCLSFLKLEADVERPITVRVEAQDIKGKKFGISLKGWQARIFQHEYDHLEGILYHDRMTPSERATILPGLVDLEKQYERRTGRPSPEQAEKVAVPQ